MLREDYLTLIGIARMLDMDDVLNSKMALAKLISKIENSEKLK